MNQKHRQDLDVNVAFSTHLTNQKCEDIDLCQNALDRSHDKLLAEVIPQAQMTKKRKLIPKWVYFKLRSLLIKASRPMIFIRKFYHSSKALKNSINKLQQSLDAVAADVEQKVLTQCHQELSAYIDQSQKNHEIMVVMLGEIQGIFSALLHEIKQEAAAILQKKEQTTHLMQQKEAQGNIAVFQKLQKLQFQVDNILPVLSQVNQNTYTNARRVAIPCGRDEVLIKTGAGYLLCSANDVPVLATLIDCGELELGTRLLIQRFLRPNDVFVDIGANIGIHTIAAGKVLNGSGKIIAFEPYEETAKLLEKSIWINGLSNITQVHKAAVSDRKGKQLLFLGKTSGHHSLFPLYNTDEPQQVEVPLVRLDEVIPKFQKVDLIKIDVEGAELQVIESAKRIINENLKIAIIIEFGLPHLRRNNTSTSTWLSIFADLGLNYKVINASTGILEDWNIETLSDEDSVNLFFARPKSEAWNRAGDLKC